MERKTYQTYHEAYDVARLENKMVYKVKGPPPGWRIQKYKRKKYKRKIRPVKYKPVVELFTAKVMQVHNLIEDYVRTKVVKDDVLRQKVLDNPPFETNWPWLVNILNEELASLQNKIEVLIK